MAPWEVDSLRIALFEQLDRVVKALDGLDEAAVNWKPPAEGANPILVLATHTAAAAEDHVVRRVCGEAVQRSRPTEFTATGSAAHIAARVEQVKRRVTDALARMDPAILAVMHDTPEGRLAGGHSLVHAVAHAAEHAGQIELTRDLWLASRR